MAAPSDPRDLPAAARLVPLDKVQYEDRRTQARVRIDHNRVAELAEVLAGDKDFDDPVEVYFDGNVYWPGDGFHRLLAYEKAGRHKVRALVREGGWQAAATHAMGANDRHGLPRSRKDLRRAVAMAFELYPKLGDRAIARICRTTHQTVSACRPPALDGDTRVYTDRYGNTGVMNVAGLRGRPRPPERVNEFHQLLPPTKDMLLGVLDRLGALSKREYAFVLAWLKGHLPPTPKEAGQLRTQLEAEGQAPDAGAESEGDAPF
jgi:hypothetical protein